MSDIGLIFKAIDFIESHLADAVTVGDMAASVSFSLYHFSRVFSRVTRHTPYDYLMRRRLSEATRCLLETERKIIDIAFEFQFNAPETFSRAFRRVYRQQPRQVKSSKNLDHRLLMTRPTLAYLYFLNKFPMKPAPQSIPAMRIAGIANQIQTCNSRMASRSLWDNFNHQLTTSELGESSKDKVGIWMYPSSKSTELTMYLAGILTNNDITAPPCFVQKDIPALKYACFKISDDPQSIRYIRKYVYQTWWPKMTSAPLPVYEIEYTSKSTGDISTTHLNSFPRTICFPLPDQ